MARLHAIARGRVQGVFFRASAQERAVQLGLTGWVRNRFDGGVEVLAEGPPEELASFRRWLAEGPPGAVVRELAEIESPASGEFTHFQVRSDG